MTRLRLGLTLGLAGLLGGCLADFRILLVGKWFTDNFAYGHSATKTLGFLAWALLLVVLSSLKLPWGGKIRAAALAAVVVSLGMSAGEQVAISQSAGISPVSFPYVIALDGAASANSVTHMHVSKAPVGWLLWDREDRRDLGEPFAAFFPSWWLALHLLLYGLAAVLVSLSAAGLVRVSGPGDAFCAVLASYSLVKSLVDGGPLWPELHVAIFALLLLTWGRKSWPYFLVIVGVLGAYLTLSPHTASFFAFWHLVATSLTLGCGPLAQRLWKRGKAQAALVVMASVGFLLWGSFYEASTRSSRNAVSHYWYSQKRVKAGQIFSIVCLKNSLPDSRLLKVDRVHQGTHFCLVEATAKEDSSFLELAQELDLNLLRKPISTIRIEPYTLAKVVSFEEWPQDWPQNEMLLDHRYRVDGSTVTLELKMRPGTNYNSFFDVLPQGLVQIKRQFTSAKPHDLEATWASSAPPTLALPKTDLKPSFLLPQPAGR